MRGEAKTLALPSRVLILRRRRRICFWAPANVDRKDPLIRSGKIVTLGSSTD
jgi:hypothetical protein